MPAPARYAPGPITDANHADPPKNHRDHNETTAALLRRPRPATISTRDAYSTNATLIVLLLLPVLAATIFETWSLPEAVASTQAWAGAWMIHAVMLTAALTATWCVANRLGISARDGFGLFPAWARPTRLLVRMELQLQAMLVFAFAVCVFMASHAILLPLALASPVPDASDTVVSTLLFLAPVQASTAIVTELVLVGLVITLTDAAKRPVWESYVVSVLARVAWVAVLGWAALLLIPVGVVAVWLYRRTRRLSPIIAAHTTAALAHTVVVVGLSLLSGRAYPPTISPVVVLPLL